VSISWLWKGAGKFPHSFFGVLMVLENSGRFRGCPSGELKGLEPCRETLSSFESTIPRFARDRPQDEDLGALLSQRVILGRSAEDPGSRGDGILAVPLTSQPFDASRLTPVMRFAYPRMTR
jgi:hypothetical protein